MNDRELLELAAKAAGVDLWHEDVFTNALTQKVSVNGVLRWNPLTDDGDALRLAVKLDIHVGPAPGNGNAIAYSVAHLAQEPHGNDKLAATRRAIVRAAAAIGEGA